MKVKDLIEYLADSDEKAEVIVYGLYPSDKTLGCAEIAMLSDEGDRVHIYVNRHEVE